MFILNILIYVFFAWAMFRMGKASYDANTDEDFIDRNLWYYIVFFVIISAVRWRVGMDSVSYVISFRDGFLKGDTTHVNGEWAFYYLCDFMSKYKIHFSIGMGLCAFIQIYCIVKGLLPHRSILVYLPVVMFGGISYLDLMNAIRQMIAACIFLYSIRFILQRSLWKYVVGLVVASLFHHSVLMLIVLYFVPPLFDISGRRWLLLCIYLACFIIGLTPQFQNLVMYLESTVAIVGYDSYVDRISMILDQTYTQEAKTFGPMQLSYFLSGLALIWYGPRLGGRYSDSIQAFRLWYLLAVVYSCGYFLVSNVSHLMLRPLMYFSLFQTIILSLLLYDLINGDERTPNDRNIAYLLIAIIWVNIAWNVTKNYGLPFESVAYKTFFLK